MAKEFWYKITIVFLILVLFFISAGLWWLWLKIQKSEPEVYYYVPPERSFIYGEEELTEFGFEEYIQERITIEKTKLIERKKDFINLDLKEMKLTLYKEGEISETFPVQSKGREGSWWETAPGVYFVGDKVVKHFSTIAQVWMPYAVQFYGNFFIHGWPYDTAGRTLLPGPSGGCVRLRTKDAAVVFEFAERGMPVLVFDQKPVIPLPALLPSEVIVSPPNIKVQAFMVADLDTGEMLLTKEINSEIYSGPVIPGMLTLTASETINLGKRILARDWMIEGIGEQIIVPGRSYRAYDLLYPLLLQSSQEAALVLSRFFTPEYFVATMNAKAQAIGMNNTHFVDLTGISKENQTTLYDIARMMRYINDYRGFIFEISRELKGPAETDKETLFTVLKMNPDKISQDSNETRTIFIALANSLDIKEDFENILAWLNNNFGLKQQK